MFKNTATFFSYSVNDIQKAKEFYTNILGLNVTDQPEGLAIHLGAGGDLFLYPKDQLPSKGIQFEHYEGIDTDEKGISRANGPTIAWFKDPAGNILSLVDAKA